jgi:hypothetical protein
MQLDDKIPFVSSIKPLMNASCLYSRKAARSREWSRTHQRPREPVWRQKDMSA